MRIIGFLLDRIAEDEKNASRWSRVEVRDGVLGTYVIEDRVVAGCEAKRRIVAFHDGPHECPRAPLPENDRAAWFGVGDDPCPTLRMVASAYADHPDHDPAWGA
ncbi:DUF6221 family protein [Nocardioides sp. SR21]|uniref:DUF6221 family protein n=1 Tax=Nocardioides sp. SR21 TaxID=2919501 RepID=UPI001FAA9DBD|nr:DUF6221 family protein [Nocardioides sp. SR21]